MKKIVIIGSTNTDMVVKSERIPVPGETVLGGKFLMNPGGKGANQAVAAARLDGKVIFVAKVGNDRFGREAKTLLAKENINTDYVMTDNKHSSGVALIMVDGKGENCISVALGANAELHVTDLEAAKDVIENAGIVLMQLETPLESVVAAAAWAANRGVPVILNPAPAAKLPPELFKCLSVITTNETEAELLTGIKVTDETSAMAAAKQLCAWGVKSVIITLGRRGAYLYRNSAGEIYAVPEVKRRGDTTAAGDVFNGALAVALNEGKTLPEAVKFANKASTISVTRLGAQSSAPYRREIID